MTIDRQRRRLGAAALLSPLAACASRSRPEGAPPTIAESAASGPWRTTPTIDLHSHAGHVLAPRGGGARPFSPITAPMRAGEIDVICLAIVADSPVTRLESGQIRAWRDPAPGELHDWSTAAFERAHALIRSEQLGIVQDRISLRSAIARPSVIMTSEGADFLEGRLDRIDEAFERWQLRQIQLVHYRVNELGDIQTAPPVHGGLTPFGREVVRRCNAKGIVVDVAHATFETTRGVAEASGRPIVLSHTSLAPRTLPLNRRISPEHARLVAATGGVIGIWPPASRFPTIAALAGGIRAMVDVVGVDHVGLGSDMLGLVGPSIFPSYRDWPALEQALREVGFDAGEVARIGGGNAARVFEACLGA